MCVPSGWRDGAQPGSAVPPVHSLPFSSVCNTVRKLKSVIDCVQYIMIKAEFINNAPNEKLFNYILLFFFSVYLAWHSMDQITDIYFIQKRKRNSFIPFE